MSGGAFDYRDNVLFDLKDMVAREIGLYEYGCADESYKPKDSRTLTYMKLICEELGKLGQALHSLDWYLSGDTSEEDFIKDYEQINHLEDK
jgi:hypothetical protein